MLITSQPQKASFSLTHELRSGDLPKQSRVKMSQVRTLSTKRLEERIGKVDPEELERLIAGLNEIIGA